MVNQRAIAIGGSIAGLLAARVLSDYFDRVIVLDRDRLPTDPEPRRGVPQSMQPHVLFTQGLRILEALFPGISKDLLTAGAVPIDWGKEFSYFNQGHWNANTTGPSGLTSFTCTRPLLEGVIRQHVKAIPNVELREGWRVVGLEGDCAAHQITGVHVTCKGHHQPQALTAQLVIDASGRSTQTPAWLKALGFTSVPVSRVDAGLGYTARRYRLPPEDWPPWKVMLISQEPPDNRRLGYFSRVENDVWMATLGGYERDYPPLDEQGFLDFAKSLAHPAFYQIIQKAEPISESLAHRATANRLYHYEQMEMPGGLIAMGDAVCALCPVYGQGMTVSALSALVLQRWLQGHEHRKRPLNTTQFQRLLARNNGLPWSIAVGQDSRFPSAQAQALPSSPAAKLFHGYLARLLNLAHQDAEVHVRLMAMTQMVAPPLSLFSPSLLWKTMIKG